MTSADTGREIAPANGKLGILLPGMGAVATTFIAGVESVRRGLKQPIGSLTQMGTVRLGKRTDNRAPMIKDLVPLAALEDDVGPARTARLQMVASADPGEPATDDDNVEVLHRS